MDQGAEPAESSARALAEIESAIAAGDRAGAYDVASRAISRGLRHPQLFLLRAERAEETGHLQFALDDYQRAHELLPDDTGILDTLADCASKLGNFTAAVAALDRAIALQPNSANLHFRRGCALVQVDDLVAAQGAFERAVELEPGHVDAMAGLALILSQRGERRRARDLAEEALKLAPNHVTAKMALINADFSEGQLAEAETHIQALIESISPSAVPPDLFAMKGDVLDRQRRYGEAFSAYRDKNEALRELYGSRYLGNSALDVVRHFTTYFENEPPDRWRADSDEAGANGEAGGHVFLLGFMRSGTTLLQQILSVNPEVAVLEEKPLLGAARDEFMLSLPALSTLAALDGTGLARLRGQYWRGVRDSLPGYSRKIVLDRHPGNVENLPLIAKLFPGARVLFALRDPRDVVFSCFRRNLKMSPVQHEFLTLRRCAQFYAATMRMAEVYRAKLALNLLAHRYEDLILQFDETVRGACEFAGIGWMEEMRRFDETAPGPQLLSPSATQVRRPLSGEGNGHWRNYADQMKSALPILEPWIDKLGYPPN